MPVQATPIDPPAQPETPFLESVIEALQQFLVEYWQLVIIFVLSLGLVFVIYLYVKREREKKDTIFERNYKESLSMALYQFNKKRKQPFALLTYALFTGFAGLVGLLMMVTLNILGFFMSWLVMPTIVLIGVAVEILFHPFSKRDEVLIRHWVGDKLFEKRIGKYEGEYYGNGGYYYLLISDGRKKLLWKNYVLLKINQKEEIYKRVVQQNDHNIILNHVKSIEKQRVFWYPVLVNDKGEILDGGVKYYESDKRNALIETLYDQTEDFGEAIRDSVKGNPFVRIKQATGEEIIEAERDRKDRELERSKSNYPYP